MTQRRDAQERERKRLHLLKIAASEFARVGFDQANINTISERAGFGKGTVYLYTANKEQLFLDVVEEIGSTTTAALDEALAQSEGKPVAARLEALVAAFARLAADHPEFVRLQASALFGVNRRFQDACAQALHPVLQHLAETFAQAAQVGAMRAVSAELIAVWLFGTLQTFALLPQALGRADGAEQSLASPPSAIADIIWRGLQPLTTGEDKRE
jgi:AcrR family transcriptional regulator